MSCNVIPTVPAFLPLMSERQRCAIWIKKLCEPATCESGVMGRKNRNMYARLLLHMLKRGVLEGPFTSRPEPGSLKMLPAYMVGRTDVITNIAIMSFSLKTPWSPNENKYHLKISIAQALATHYTQTCSPISPLCLV